VISEAHFVRQCPVEDDSTNGRLNPLTSLVSDFDCFTQLYTFDFECESGVLDRVRFLRKSGYAHPASRLTQTA